MELWCFVCIILSYVVSEWCSYGDVSASAHDDTLYDTLNKAQQACTGNCIAILKKGNLYYKIETSHDPKYSYVDGNVVYFKETCPTVLSITPAGKPSIFCVVTGSTAWGVM